MRILWPFKPVSPVLDSFIWSTDVIKTKSSEQRIALRRRPARIFNLVFEITEIEANYATNLILENLGSGGFYVPDWTQTVFVDNISGGTDVETEINSKNRIYGDFAVVWKNAFEYEVVRLELDSFGVHDSNLVISDLVDSYSNAYIIPVWPCEIPAGISIQNRGAKRISMSAEFVIDSVPDFGDGNFEQYRGVDVVSDCPVISPSLSKTFSFQLSSFGNIGASEYIRQRDFVDSEFNIQWQKFGHADSIELKKWVATRYGMQKAFWAPTFQQDLEPADSFSGSEIQVFNDIISKDAPFHIEIADKNGGIYRREVISIVSSSEYVDGRVTVYLEIDSPVNISHSNISRISYLLYCRFNSDRAEFSHSAPNTMRLNMSCVEAPYTDDISST